MSDLIKVSFNMPRREILAQECAKANGEDFVVWMDAFNEGYELAKEAHIDPDAFNNIVHACNDTKRFCLMMEAFSEHAKENPEGENAFNLLLRHVRASKFDLPSWMISIEYFYNWLDQNNRHASLINILGFIKGCESSKSSGDISIKLNLKELLTRMLDRYGYQE